MEAAGGIAPALGLSASEVTTPSVRDGGKHFIDRSSNSAQTKTVAVEGWPALLGNNDTFNEQIPGMGKRTPPTDLDEGGINQGQYK